MKASKENRQSLLGLGHPSEGSFAQLREGAETTVPFLGFKGKLKWEQAQNPNMRVYTCWLSLHMSVVDPAGFSLGLFGCRFGCW